MDAGTTRARLAVATLSTLALLTPRGLLSGVRVGQSFVALSYGH